MGFRHPLAFLWYLPFALLLAVFAWSRWTRRRQLQSMGDWRLLSLLVPVAALRRRRLKDRIALVALFVLIFAAAGPQFGTRLKEVKQRGVDVFIAIDTSRSMLAEDAPPSRLERAKRSLSLLINKLDGNRVGVLAFAGRAVTLCPLTVDTNAARLLLETVNVNTVPEQGTAIGSAIRLALSRFPQGVHSGRAIVLLTDGEDHGSDPEEAAKEAKKQGVVLFTIGIGTTKGEVIKNRDANGNVTEFMKHNGEMVITHLDDALLSKIAEMTGGTYYRASSTDHEIDEIADVLNDFQKRELTTKMFDRREERFVPFTVAGLILLLLEFFFGETPGQRRRVAARLRAMRAPRSPTGAATAVGALMLVLSLAAPARADVRSQVRDGNRLVRKGDLEGAAKQFESAEIDDPDNPMLAYNLGTVATLRGQDEEALKYFDRAQSLTRDPALQARIAYNAGYALFHMGKTQDAVEKFKQSLRLNPRDMDAKYNIEYIRSGKKPKASAQKPSGTPPQPSPNASQTPSEQKQQKAAAQPSAAPSPKPGELSKEDAERILQMTQDEESEKLKERPVRPLGSQESPVSTGEDW